MPNYTVYLSTYFSESVDVEAENETDATDLALEEFVADYSVYCASAGHTIPFDDVNVDDIDEGTND